jgi:hypothetical protein
VLISKLENWVKPLFSRFSSTAEEHQAAHTPAE